jgi:hypothetical protein
MAQDLTTSYFSIEKSDKQADGTLMVYGKATDDSVDIDQQICDAAWLDRAMPAWFKSGGNIREQHSSIAAGVAKEYESKADGHYIMAHVVDPVSVKKVDAGVLRGFSIGIKSPRVVRDNKAANGRIIDGQIVEVSLVDRPANPNCQLVLAKSVDGESSLIQVEELTDKHADHDQSSHGGGRGGAGGAGGAAEAVDDELSANQKTTLKGHEADARGLSDTTTELARQDSMVRPAAQNMREATRHLEEATNAKTSREAVSSVKKAKGAVDRAVTNLEDQNYNTEASDAFSFSKRLNTTASALGRGVGKSTGADAIKHADHDQSSHGGGRGGGGAGGGAAITEEQKAKVSAAKDNLKKLNDKVYSENAKTQSSKTIDEGAKLDAQQGVEDAQWRIDDAQESLKRASNAQTPKDYARNMNDAGKNMQAAGDHVYNTAATNSQRNVGEDLMIAGAKLQQEAINANKALESSKDYRKALQSALQLLSLNKSEETPMKDSIVELPTEAVGDLLKFDKIQYEAAREALANLIAVEAGEMRDGHNELQSIAHLLEAVAHLHAWYEGEKAEGEVMEQETEIELAAVPTDKEMKPKKGESLAEFKARCKEAGMADDYADKMYGKYMGAEEDTEKSADIAKCLECGCNQPGSDHGLKTTNDFANIAMPSNVSTAEMYAPGETPKSAEADETATEEAPTEETLTEASVEKAVTENSEAPTEVDAADVEAIVEQVVKSATESLRAEIASLVAAKEVALEKSVNLESELAIAKSLAVAGGPSRTTKPLSTKINDNLTKAAIYKAKANATTDPVLAKGYKQLAEEFYSKASDSDNN